MHDEGRGPAQKDPIISRADGEGTRMTRGIDAAQMTNGAAAIDSKSISNESERRVLIRLSGDVEARRFVSACC
jgi:hypothetical protein